MAFRLARGQKKIYSMLCDCLSRLRRATHHSLLPMISWLPRMTGFTSSVSITPKRAFNWPETAIQSIRRLSAESGETHLALAQNLYWAYADYGRAREELAPAARTLPNESRIPLMFGYIYRWEGQWERSLEQMNKVLELDPHNFSILQQIALTYQALRRYKEMAATLDSALAMAPKDIPSRVRRAWIDLESHANPKPLH